MCNPDVSTGSEVCAVPCSALLKADLRKRNLRMISNDNVPSMINLNAWACIAPARRFCNGKAGRATQLKTIRSESDLENSEL